MGWGEVDEMSANGEGAMELVFSYEICMRCGPSMRMGSDERNLKFV